MRKKILIIQPNNLGDVINTTPVLIKLKKNSEVYLLTRKENKDYLTNFRDIKICYFNDKKSFLKIVFKRFDGIYELSGQLKNIYLLLFFWGRKYTRSKSSRKKIEFYLQKIISKIFKITRIPTGNEEETKRIFEILALRGNGGALTNFFYPASKKEEKKIENKNFSDLVRNYIVIQPYTGWLARSMSKRIVKDIIDIIRKKNYFIIFTGNKKEGEMITKNFSKELKEGLIKNYAGKLNIKEVTALINQARLFIGNDSGLSHLAATTKTKSIIFFGPGDFKRWHHRNQINIYKPLECSPCKQKTGTKKCARGRKICLSYQKVSKKEIKEKIELALSE
ncbi:MAG: glycosyltransferase family 9 protein [Promethearchaeota archaeon]